MKHLASHLRAPTTRHAALLQRCALQRLMLAAEVNNLTMPLDPRLLRMRLQHSTMPFIIAGAALGLLATRPKHILTAVLAGAAKLKSAGAMLALARGITDRFRRTRGKRSGTP